MKFESRIANPEDKEWLFSLYVSTLKVFIDKTWGWNEEFQRNEFNSNLHPAHFIIISDKNEDVAAYVLMKREDHYWLEMLMVTPKRQKQGVGKWIMTRIIKKSSQMKLPLALSIMKINPVISFYTKLGFSVFEEDNDIVKLKRMYDK